MAPVSQRMNVGQLRLSRKGIRRPWSLRLLPEIALAVSEGSLLLSIDAEQVQTEDRI